jgi:hypothetical protein
LLKRLKTADLRRNQTYEVAHSKPEVLCDRVAPLRFRSSYQKQSYGNTSELRINGKH